MPRDTYLPDVASLDRGFPDGLPVPELLRAFADWLGTQPRSSLGWFHLESDLVPASWVADDDALAALRAELGVFLRLPAGARIALWQRPEGPPAVVRVGPAEVRTEVAADLESFLVALARADTGIAELDRNRDDPARSRLAHWLEARGVRDLGRPLAAGSFGRWFDRTVAAAQRHPSVLQPSAAELPPDLFERTDRLIGLLADDPRVLEFFAGLGMPLEAIRNPEQLRFLARASEGVVFSIAWPWDRPSEWLEREFPPAERAAIERRRARMLWSIELIVAPERRTIPGTGAVHDLAAYGGELPFGIERDDDIDRLEAKLGPPIVGRYGYRTWDDPVKRRSLTLGLNEGAVIRSDLPRGALTWIRWQRSQSL